MTVKIIGIDKKVTAEYMTVGELIELLHLVDPTLPVGCVGHFGELHEMDKYRFWVTSCERIEYGYHGKECEQFTALAISVPDIGPEPD